MTSLSILFQYFISLPQHTFQFFPCGLRLLLVPEQGKLFDKYGMYMFVHSLSNN